MSRIGGVSPLPVSDDLAGDWLDRLWAHEDLAPAPVAPRERKAGAACAGLDPEMFFPEASPMAAAPLREEREALAVCADCPVQSWCLAQEMNECSTASRVIGVRGGMRQVERRALHVRLFGKRARNGVQQ
ncbi:WhiB family transcriptional regulator [Streptomyces subrutilus]|uniref:WhiB family transcriptional regulator n=1 Tax=Streptomyces subrutilus TaxID=36818 RepID=UPI003414A479